LISILTRTGLRLMSVVGPSRQAAFYGSTVANGRVEMWRGGGRLNISVSASFV
jgi:hypothetical protein